MIPMALKELIAAFINLLESVMLGGFGEDVIAGVGIANQWFLLLSIGGQKTLPGCEKCWG